MGSVRRSQLEGVSGVAVLQEERALPAGGDPGFQALPGQSAAHRVRAEGAQRQGRRPVRAGLLQSGAAGARAAGTRRGAGLRGGVDGEAARGGRPVADAAVEGGLPRRLLGV